MPRIWSIQEQVYTEAVSGLFMEFTSAPTHDDDSKVILNLYNEGRTKKISITFDRNGMALAAELVPMSGAADVDVTAGQAASPEVQEPLGTVDATQDAAHPGEVNLGVAQPAKF